MLVRQTALTGRPEIIFSGRGYKAAGMTHNALLLSLLETEWAQAHLSRLESENNLEAVNEFHQSDGWRIFYPKPIYQNRIPLYSILDAYRLTFKDILILYGVLRNLEFYEPQSDEATPKEDIDDFIAETESIMPFLQLLDIIDIPQRKKNELRFDKLLAYQMFFGEMVILETDRDKARAYMLDNGIAQKKNAHGLLLQQEGRGDNQDATTIPDNRIQLRIDPKPWAAMSLEDAAKYLKSQYGKHEIVCLCLCYIADMKRDKTRLGKLLYTPKRKDKRVHDEDKRNRNKENIHEESTYRRNFEKIFARANSQYNLIIQD